MLGRKKRTQTLARLAEVITVRPDDRLVVTCSERISQAAVAEMGRAVAEFAGIDRERVLVVVNARISVLRHGDPPPPPVYIAPAKEARGI